jgi:hypothetical protein
MPRDVLHLQGQAEGIDPEPRPKISLHSIPNGETMKAEDIPEAPILKFLAIHGGIGCNRFKTLDSERCIFHAMPPDTPEKVGVAKMKSLIKRGLVSGCCCGCRGDFELTTAGRELATEKP